MTISEGADVWGQMSYILCADMAIAGSHQHKRTESFIIKDHFVWSKYYNRSRVCVCSLCTLSVERNDC